MYNKNSFSTSVTRIRAVISMNQVESMITHNYARILYIQVTTYLLCALIVIMVDVMVDNSKFLLIL